MTFGLRAGSEASAPADPIVPDEVDSSTPWVAAADGDLGLLQSSLARLGLPSTAADERGYTLLHAAASYGRLDVMRWLVAAAASSYYPNAADADGDTALHYASDTDVARFLVESAGSDPTIRNGAGMTPLQLKRADLEEALLDDGGGGGDDGDDDDDDVINLRSIIAYLESLSTMPQ